MYAQMEDSIDARETIIHAYELWRNTLSARTRGV